jgi:hypothetical protein
MKVRNAAKLLIKAFNNEFEWVNCCPGGGSDAECLVTACHRVLRHNDACKLIDALELHIPKKYKGDLPKWNDSRKNVGQIVALLEKVAS